MLKASPLDPDRWGTIASTICAIHCAITGILVSVLSVLGFAFLRSPVLEWGFLGFALLFGMWAAVRGYQRHKQAVPLLVFVMGIGLLIGSHLVVPLSAGGISLIVFHAMNKQAMNRCR